MTKAKTLTETDRARIEYLARGIAGGHTAQKTADEIGVNNRQMISLFIRARNAGIDFFRLIGERYAELYARNAQAGKEAPPLPFEETYRTAILVECARRGFDLCRISKFKDQGLCPEIARRELERRRGELRPPEYRRLRELLHYKVLLNAQRKAERRKRRRWND